MSRTELKNKYLLIGVKSQAGDLPIVGQNGHRMFVCVFTVHKYVAHFVARHNVLPVWTHLHRGKHRCETYNSDGMSGCRININSRCESAG